jgi:hypothetical protein
MSIIAKAECRLFDAPDVALIVNTFYLVYLTPNHSHAIQRTEQLYYNNTEVLRPHHSAGPLAHISKSSLGFGVSRHCLVRLPSAPVRPTLTIVVNKTISLSTELIFKTFHKLSNMTIKIHNVATIATNLGALRYA